MHLIVDKQIYIALTRDEVLRHSQLPRRPDVLIVTCAWYIYMLYMYEYICSSISHYARMQLISSVPSPNIARPAQTRPSWPSGGPCRVPCRPAALLACWPAHTVASALLPMYCLVRYSVECKCYLGSQLGGHLLQVLVDRHFGGVLLLAAAAGNGNTNGQPWAIRPPVTKPEEP